MTAKSPDPRAAVRVARLEKRLTDFNADQGAKTAFLLGEFHSRYVEPLVRHLDELDAEVVFPAPLAACWQRWLCRIGIHSGARRREAGPVPGTNASYIVASCSCCPKTWVGIGQPYAQSEYIRYASR